jgi:hypothetical protein
MSKESDLCFIEHLFELGDVTLASEAMGVTTRTGRRIVSRNRQLVLDMTTDELAMGAPKAVKTMFAGMDEDGTVAKGDIRLKAAGELLDRIGAAKKTTAELEIKVDTPIILMPSKDIEVTPTIKVSTTEDFE